MSDEPKLLVVDDEAVICQACRRIFSRQGFQVEESTSAREGLSRATQRDYDGILLDIKMPEMDGIRFLESLRQEKPDIPVLIMTGYPSVPNAAAAVRLGASDYVTKPFTPEEITQSLQRMLGNRGPGGASKPDAAAQSVELEAWEGEGLLFLDESWFRLEQDGSACAGAVLPRLARTGVQAVTLPRIGEVVYQGLPLAGVSVEEGPPIFLPSPVSGVVVAVNEALCGDPTLLATDPCGRGWIACVCTTRLEKELGRCRARRVILVSVDEASLAVQRERLMAMGCRVNVAGSWEEISSAVGDPDYDVLVFDATSFGDDGPELVRKINAAAPSMRLVVASSGPQREVAYREQKIFYYAVEPFADGEIVEVLDAAFRSQTAPVRKAHSRPAPSDAVASISITNRNRTKVRLLAEPGLLQRDYGLGLQIRQKLTDWMFPVVTTPGEAQLSPTDVVKAAGTCDRLMVLTARDSGRLPGSLVRDTKAEFGSVAGEKVSKVTTLEVQPDPIGGGLAGLDERTTAALAEHIAQEMASY
jgi:DNA-binding response OmpR family regulator